MLFESNEILLGAAWPAHILFVVSMFWQVSETALQDASEGRLQLGEVAVVSDNWSRDRSRKVVVINTEEDLQQRVRDLVPSACFNC